MSDQRPDCIRDRLVFSEDDNRRQANTLARQGFHQQAAECRARARQAEVILNWIDNGVPLYPPLAAIAKSQPSPKEQT